MLASEVAAERCAGTEHEHGFVQIDVCLWIVDQRVADALFVRGETIQIGKRPLEGRMKRPATFERFQGWIQGLCSRVKMACCGFNCVDALAHRAGIVTSADAI